MPTCTFDSVTVPSRQILNEDGDGTYYYEVELECRTETYSEYTAIRAKFGPDPVVDRLKAGKTRVTSDLGVKGTLVLNGVTRNNCVITALTNSEVSQSNLGAWSFRIKFVQDTAT